MQVAAKINSPRAARAAFLAEIPDTLRKHYRKGVPLLQQQRDVLYAWIRWAAEARLGGRLTFEISAYANL